MLEDKLPKIDVPQLDPDTGISHDYINVIASFASCYFDNALSSEKRRKVFQIFRRDLPIKKYEERYPSDKFRNVVNEKNKNRVMKLDEAIEKLNQLLKDNIDNPEKYKPLMNDISMQIYDHPFRMFSD